MAQSDLTKRALAEAMKQCMRSSSIEKITIDMVLERAQVSRRSFYRYFPDKYALVEWIYQNDFCKYIEVKKEKSIWDYYCDICRNLYEDKDFYKNAFSFEGQNSFRAFCFEKLFPLIMNDFGDVFPNEETARFAIRRYVYAAFDGYVWWLGQKPCMPWQEYVEYSKSVIHATAAGVIRSFEKSDGSKSV